MTTAYATCKYTPNHTQHQSMSQKRARSAEFETVRRSNTNVCDNDLADRRIPPHGIQWRDEESGCTVIAAQPAAQPNLWNEYLDGAHRSFRRHGIECVLDLESIRDGKSTIVFFAIVNFSGRVIAGTRAVGPLRSAEEAHAVEEWSRTPSVPAVRKIITDRVPFGFVESKSGWADERFACAALPALLARTPLLAAVVANVRYSIATTASYLLRR